MNESKCFGQRLSDALQENILRPYNIETTAHGACIVAQKSEGVLIDDIRSQIENSYEPQKSLRNFLETDYKIWKNYIEKTISNIK